ncbi:hypothetical protein Q5752_003400 [Cryptotrichosporon argae]
MSSPLLTTLLAQPLVPPFIYVHHPHHPTPSLSLVAPAAASSSTARVATLDAIEHHTPRLLYSSIVARLSRTCGHEVEAEIKTFDALARALRGVFAAAKATGNGKGKGKAGEASADGLGDAAHAHGVAIIVITKAERLRSVLGPRWAAITRLGELAELPITVVLASQVPYDTLRPLAAPEPVHVAVAPVLREAATVALLPASPHPLWPRFLDLVGAATAALLPAGPPLDLAYLADALWPIYVAPLPPHREMRALGLEYPASKADTDTDANAVANADSDGEPDAPPPLEISVKLLTDLKHQLALALAAAIESVLPRTVGAADFAAAMHPTAVPAADADAHARGHALARPLGLPRPPRNVPRPPAIELPTAARFLVVAAYCASYNPAKSDLRLFGRGVGADRKRKRGGGTRRAGYGRTRVGKVPQRLLGPKPFPLDRLLALFAALYAEHAPRPEDLDPSALSDDDDAALRRWPPPSTSSVNTAAVVARLERRRAHEIEADEQWEDVVDALTMSAKLWALIPELESQGLLRRVSPVDRLDNVQLRCEADYETAKTFAKELRITLDEYLYEATL